MFNQMLTYKGKPVYICENQYGKTLVIPESFVLNNPLNPSISSIFVKTRNSGMYPFSELRCFNISDNKEFSEFVLECQVTEISKIELFQNHPCQTLVSGVYLNT
jgi:hypothetical protein